MSLEDFANEIVDHVNELLKLVQSIRLDIYINKNPAKKLDEALLKTELIYAELFRLYDIFTNKH